MLISNCPVKAKAVAIIVKASCAFLMRRQKTLEYLISLQEDDLHLWDLICPNIHIPQHIKSDIATCATKTEATDVSALIQAVMGHI